MPSSAPSRPTVSLSARSAPATGPYFVLFATCYCLPPTVDYVLPTTYYHYLLLTNYYFRPTTCYRIVYVDGLRATSPAAVARQLRELCGEVTPLTINYS